MKTPPITAQQLVDAACRGIEEIPADEVPRRVALAAESLVRMGFGAVASLAGGILGWQQEGRSLITGA
ncbi:MAG: rhodanese-like domain-containing protein [Rhodanobacter sp.]|nr:MAG: rhodanese-like domain-containing protein [Rhodanobacter sp.]